MVSDGTWVHDVVIDGKGVGVLVEVRDQDRYTYMVESVNGGFRHVYKCRKNNLANVLRTAVGELSGGLGIDDLEITQTAHWRWSDAD